MLGVADVLRSRKEHVLEEMREAGAAAALILRADVIPEVDGHQRRGVILVENHPQAVWQAIVFDRKHWARGSITDSFILARAWSSSRGVTSPLKGRSVSARRRWSLCWRSASEGRRSSRMWTTRFSTTS